MTLHAPTKPLHGGSWKRPSVRETDGNQPFGVPRQRRRTLRALPESEVIWIYLKGSWSVVTVCVNLFSTLNTHAFGLNRQRRGPVNPLQAIVPWLKDCMRAYRCRRNCCIKYSNDAEKLDLLLLVMFHEQVDLGILTSPPGSRGKRSL